MKSTLPKPEYLVIFETVDGSPCDLSGKSRAGLTHHFRKELAGKTVQPYSVRVQGKNVVRIERLNPPTPSAMVREFHEKYEHPVHEEPTHPSREREELRTSLIAEELMELGEALELPVTNEQAKQERSIAIADALADLIYVTYGAAHEWGIPLDHVVAEVHRSNLTKLGDDGRPIYNTLGKVEKGPNFEEPDIRSILFPEEDEEEAES